MSVRLAKWLSVCLRTKWLWVRVPLQSLKRLIWFGHVCCLNDESLQKWMMKEDFNKRRNRGRPKKRWTDLIKEDTKLPVATAEKYAKDRKKGETM